MRILKCGKIIEPRSHSQKVGFKNWIVYSSFSFFFLGGDGGKGMCWGKFLACPRVTACKAWRPCFTLKLSVLPLSMRLPCVLSTLKLCCLFQGCLPSKEVLCSTGSTFFLGFFSLFLVKLILRFPACFLFFIWVFSDLFFVIWLIPYPWNILFGKSYQNFCPCPSLLLSAWPFREMKHRNFLT